MIMTTNESLKPTYDKNQQEQGLMTTQGGRTHCTYEHIFKILMSQESPHIPNASAS